MATSDRRRPPNHRFSQQSAHSRNYTPQPSLASIPPKADALPRWGFATSGGMRSEAHGAGRPLYHSASSFRARRSHGFDPSPSGWLGFSGRCEYIPGVPKTLPMPSMARHCWLRLAPVLPYMASRSSGHRAQLGGARDCARSCASQTLALAPRKAMLFVCFADRASHCLARPLNHSQPDGDQRCGHPVILRTVRQTRRISPGRYWRKRRRYRAMSSFAAFCPSAI